MGDRQTKIIDGTIQVAPFIQSLYAKIMKGLETGAVAVDLYRPEERRSIPQNKKGWALWTDISNHLEWYGKKRSPRFWKEFLSSELGDSEIVPNANGNGFFVFGKSTSEMKVREFSDLIMISYAFGSAHNVPWSEQSLREYELYANMQ